MSRPAVVYRVSASLLRAVKMSRRSSTIFRGAGFLLFVENERVTRFFFFVVVHHLNFFPSAFLWNIQPIIY